MAIKLSFIVVLGFNFIWNQNQTVYCSSLLCSIFVLARIYYPRFMCQYDDFRKSLLLSRFHGYNLWIQIIKFLHYTEDTEAQRYNMNDMF